LQFGSSDRDGVCVCLRVFVLLQCSLAAETPDRIKTRAWCTERGLSTRTRQFQRSLADWIYDLSVDVDYDVEL